MKYKLRLKGYDGKWFTSYSNPFYSRAGAREHAETVGAPKHSITLIKPREKAALKASKTRSQT